MHILIATCNSSELLQAKPQPFTLLYPPYPFLGEITVVYAIKTHRTPKRVVVVYLFSRKLETKQLKKPFTQWVQIKLTRQFKMLAELLEGNKRFVRTLMLKFIKQNQQHLSHRSAAADESQVLTDLCALKPFVTELD